MFYIYTHSLTLTNNIEQKNNTFFCDSIYIQCQEHAKTFIHQNSNSFGEKGRHGRGHEEDFWDGNNFVFLNLGSTYITFFCDNSSSCVLITGTLDCIPVTLQQTCLLS